MSMRLPFLLVAGALALPGASAASSPFTATGGASVEEAASQEVPPKDDEKKNEVTVWVLDASGKG